MIGFQAAASRPSQAAASALSSSAPWKGVTENPSTSQAPPFAASKALTAPQIEPSAAAARSARPASGRGPAAGARHPRRGS